MVHMSGKGGKAMSAGHGDAVEAARRITGSHHCYRGPDDSTTFEEYIADAEQVARAFLALSWMPIETAPLDKTMVALLHESDNYRRYGVGWYMPMSGWHGWDAGGLQPTHWMPLPPPPSGSKAAK